MWSCVDTGYGAGSCCDPKARESILKANPPAAPNGHYNNKVVDKSGEWMAWLMFRSTNHIALFQIGKCAIGVRWASRDSFQSHFLISPKEKTLLPEYRTECRWFITSVRCLVLNRGHYRNKILQGVESPLCSVSYPLRHISFLIKAPLLIWSRCNKLKEGAQGRRITWYVALNWERYDREGFIRFFQTHKINFQIFSAGFR